MADSSLDDFFAKKDKSKKTKGKKLSAGSGIQPGGDDGITAEKKRTKKDIKDKSSNCSNTAASVPVSQLKKDDEWHDYEEVEKDYSDLKIQSLQISEKEKEDSEKDSEQELDEDGEPVTSKDSQSGPWKIMSTPAPEQPPAEVKEDTMEKVVTGGRYVIPQDRLRSSTDRTPLKRNRLNKSAPKIDCESDFPSLSSAIESSGLKSDNADNQDFEKVKHGSRSRDEPSRSMCPKLDLGNKYNALSAGNM